MPIHVLRNCQLVKCQEQDTADEIRQDAPGLVKMVEAEEDTICHPTPPAKRALHLGKQYSANQQLLSENRIGDGVDYKQGKEPPGADELGQYHRASPGPASFGSIRSQCWPAQCGSAEPR